jgi:hypothetical protein
LHGREVFPPRAIGVFTQRIAARQEQLAARRRVTRRTVKE